MKLRLRDPHARFSPCKIQIPPSRTIKAPIRLLMARITTLNALRIAHLPPNSPSSNCVATTSLGLAGPNLLQPRKLYLDLLHDWDIRVGVFPEREKLLVFRPRLVLVTKRRVGPSQLDVRERAHGIVHHQAAMVENPLEFGCGFCALL